MTFTREELANYGKTTAATQDKIEEAADAAADEAAEKTADETADETTDEAEAAGKAEVEPVVTPATSDFELEDTDVKFSQSAISAVPLDDEPMPDLADKDVAFDNAKYRAKMQKWVDRRADTAAERAIQEVQRAKNTKEVLAHVEAEAKAFAKQHPDFEQVVTRNAVLAQNQLAHDAGLAVAADRNVAAILYYFGKNTQYAVQVARMPPAQQLVEVGKLKQKIAIQLRAAATTRPERTDQGSKTITRSKGPVTRDQQMSTGVEDLARQARARIKTKRFYK